MSELGQKNEARMDKLVASGRGQHEPLKLASRYASSLGTQRIWLIKRFFAIYWRSPQYSKSPEVWGLRLAPQVALGRRKAAWARIGSLTVIGGGL